jgi:hypothetical protein
MNKQEFAQQLALRVIANNPTHHTHQSFSVSILNAVKQCVKVANTIEAEAPEFFGSPTVESVFGINPAHGKIISTAEALPDAEDKEFVPIDLPTTSKGKPHV